MKRRIWESFGFISTAFLGALALLPKSFHLLPGLYPWVFLGAILWFFLLITGFFKG